MAETIPPNPSDEKLRNLIREYGFDATDKLDSYEYNYKSGKIEIVQPPEPPKEESETK